MYSAEKQLKMLASNKASVRYDACEWIRVSQESSPQIVTALEKATHDADIEVAERAALALQADVHHQMAIKIGMIEPDKKGENEADRLSEINDRNTIRKPSKLGIASFGIMIFTGILIIVYIIIDQVRYGQGYTTYYIEQLLNQFFVLSCLAIPVLSLAACVLGVLGLIKKEQSGYAGLGVFLSIIVLIIYSLAVWGLSANN